ncbi:MAG TPA: hypothetical protein P5277_03560 [Candidatus Paceibacterota bacterium]|nr:hypothetical protein [Candidatus Paceibacterota bacterium]
MKLVGFNFSKISGEKYKDIDNSLKVNVNVQIKDIKQSPTSFFKKGEILDFKYDFKINYEPDFANIHQSGNLLLLIEDESEIKQILKDWKTKNVSENLRTFLMNLVISKCNLKALQIEEDLSLPSHMPSPQVIKQEEKNLVDKKEYTK